MLLFKQLVLGLMFGIVAGWLIKRSVTPTEKRPVRGPSSKHVKQTIYYDQLTNQHYRFHPVTHVCPPSVDVDALEHSDDDDDSDDA